MAMCDAMRRASSREASSPPRDARFLLEIDMGQREPVGVANDEARFGFLSTPWWGSGVSPAFSASLRAAR